MSNSLDNVIRQLNDEFSAAPQLTAEDMAAVAELGFKSLVINRPDGEGGEDQPKSADVMAAAEAVGIQAHYLPVISGGMTEGDVEKFQILLESLPRPILAYCRSGNRSMVLYATATQAS